ncbi:MAG: hypothetical protein Q9163_000296 [Psora crenata]
MDFVQNVGQSYLQRKAYQAPYQLENLVKNQFTGGDKGARINAGQAKGQSPDGQEYHGVAAQPNGTSTIVSSQRDAELVRLGAELAAHKLDPGKSNVSAQTKEKRYPGERVPNPTTKAGTLNALDGRLENGKLSMKPNVSIQPEKKSSKAINPLVALEALDGRLEKGQFSTRKPNKALEEARGSADRRRLSGSSAAVSPLGRDKAASLAASSEASPRRRASSITSDSSSYGVPYSTVPSRNVSHERHAASYSASPETRSSSHSRRSIEEKSEHGGSAALLHAREKYRRRSSLGAVPEIPALERRPEVIGQGFRPRRSSQNRVVGTVEVIEEPTRRAPRVKEVHKGPRKGDDRVVEVRRETGGRTLYKVG